jgi:hypothetical protein
MADGQGVGLIRSGEVARVELLYLEGCPGYARIRPTVRRLAEAAGAEFRERRIDTPEEARAARFLGSPTVRVGGADIEPGADARADYGLKCRLYRSDRGLADIPLEEWLYRAIAR